MRRLVFIVLTSYVFQSPALSAETQTLDANLKKPSTPLLDRMNSKARIASHKRILDELKELVLGIELSLKNCKKLPDKVGPIRLTITGINKVNVEKSSGSKELDLAVKESIQSFLNKSLQWHSEKQITIEKVDSILKVTKVNPKPWSYLSIKDEFLKKPKVLKDSMLVGESEKSNY